MKIIAHRANLEGPDKYLENTISQIEKCIKLGFDVECDLRFIDGEYLLGHDEGIHTIDINDLKKYADSLWIHCKNLQALEMLSQGNNQKILNFFWHQTDMYTLTSKGFIWSFPGNKLSPNCVQVMPELNMEVRDIKHLDKSKIYGICTDYPILLK